MAVSASSKEAGPGKLSWPIGLFMLLLMAGCRRAPGPEFTITWKVPKPGLAEGTPLRYESIGTGQGTNGATAAGAKGMPAGSQSIEIGQVTRVVATPDRVVVRAVVRWKYAHYIHTNMDFLFQPASETGGAFIEVTAPNKDAPLAPPGHGFEGIESRDRGLIPALLTDWKRTALFGGIGLGFLLALVVMAKALLKLWGVALSSAGGAVVAVTFAPIVAEYLRPLLPKGTRVDLLAPLAAFLVGSLVTSIVLGMVVRSFRSHA